MKRKGLFDGKKKDELEKKFIFMLTLLPTGVQKKS
jgi:hypothetical protein